jgi:iron complex transport system substrate-binding protein
MNRTTLIVLTLAFALIAAACGDSDSADSTTAAPAATTTTAAPVATTAPPAPTTTAPPTTTEAPTERVFVGADGVETTITDTSRLVTLTGDLTEIVFELGLGGSIVGVDVTTTYPEEGAALNERGDTVGFAQQLTAEAVLRFAPTLVIGDQTVAPPEAIEQLRGAGVAVVILETQSTLDGVATKINQVAEILGVPDAGTTLAARVQGEIDDARQLAAGAQTELSIAYVYLRGPQVIFLFGGGMATSAMIDGAGAIDAGAATGVFGPAPLTPEALVAAAPDIIVLPEAGLAALGGIEAFLLLPGVAGTPAAQNDAFLAYDEAFFFNLGPRVGQALDQFVRDLYPNLDG